MTPPGEANALELLTRLGPYLRRFAVEGGRVVVEIEHGGRLVGLARPVPAGDLVELAEVARELLGDAVRIARALRQGAPLGDFTRARAYQDAIGAIADQVEANGIFTGDEHAAELRRAVEVER
jgi:hypothetical protein